MIVAISGSTGAVAGVRQASGLLQAIPRGALACLALGAFACNAVVLDKRIILPDRCPRLTAALYERGYELHALPMSEFLKAGGACKCLTLFLPQRE